MKKNTPNTSKPTTSVSNAGLIPEVYEKPSKKGKVLRVKGFFPKNVIHAAGAAHKLHSTTLVLVAKVVDGVLYVARCAKWPKSKKVFPDKPCDKYVFDKLPSHPLFGNTPLWDIIGGHLDGKDFPNGGKAEDSVDEVVFRAGAERELGEELTDETKVRLDFDKLISKLVFLGTISYGPAELPDNGGTNEEISGVFLLPLSPNEPSPGFQDDCKCTRDLKGKSLRKPTEKNLRFYTEWVKFDSLLGEVQRNPNSFMDGLLRIVLYYAKTGSQGVLADYAKAVLKKP